MGECVFIDFMCKKASKLCGSLRGLPFFLIVLSLPLVASDCTASDKVLRPDDKSVVRRSSVVPTAGIVVPEKTMITQERINTNKISQPSQMVTKEPDFLAHVNEEFTKIIVFLLFLSNEKSRGGYIKKHQKSEEECKKECLELALQGMSNMQPRFQAVRIHVSNLESRVKQHESDQHETQQLKLLLVTKNVEHEEQSQQLITYSNENDHLKKENLQLKLVVEANAKLERQSNTHGNNVVDFPQAENQEFNKKKACERWHCALF